MIIAGYPWNVDQEVVSPIVFPVPALNFEPRFWRNEIVPESVRSRLFTNRIFQNVLPKVKSGKAVTFSFVTPVKLLVIPDPSRAVPIWL